MQFIMKCEHIKVVQTERKKNSLDVYMDNNPLLFIWAIAIPFFGILVAIIHTLSQRNRLRGKILIDTTKCK